MTKLISRREAQTAEWLSMGVYSLAASAASAAMSPTGSPLIDIAKWPSMLQAAGCKLHVACCWIAEGGCRLEDEA